MAEAIRMIRLRQEIKEKSRITQELKCDHQKPRQKTKSEVKNQKIIPQESHVGIENNSLNANSTKHKFGDQDAGWVGCTHLGDEAKKLPRVRTEEKPHDHAVERDLHLQH